MRCSGLQTTCTAVEAPVRSQAVRTLEALLFAKVLEPLAKPLGPVGEITLTAVAERVFVPDAR